MIGPAGRQPSTPENGRSALGSKQRRIAVQMAILAIGLAISIVSYQVAIRTDDERVASVVALRVQWRASDMAVKVKLPGESVRTIAAAFTSLSDDEIMSYDQELIRQFRTLGISRSYVWIRRVTAGERDAFERQMRETGPRDFSILEADGKGKLVTTSPRAEYWPLTRSWVFKGPPPPIGFDYLFDPVRSQALAGARDKGHHTVSDPIIAISSGLATILFNSPVYRGGRVPGSTEERRADLRGFVRGALIASELFNRSIVDTPAIVEDIYISTDEAGGGKTALTPFLRYQAATGKFETHVGPVDPTALPGRVITLPLFAGDQQWVATFHFPPDVIAGLRTPYLWVWLAAGLIITGLVLLIVDLEARQVVRARRIIDRATSELRSQTAELAQVNSSLRQEAAARAALNTHLAGEQILLEHLARGEPLGQFLDRLALSFEARCQGAMGSIALLDNERQQLRHVAAPSLPPAYCQAIDRAEIGPNARSCGSAAYTGKSTVVTDIASDPLWQDYRDLALAHGLSACWSVPIFSSREDVLGTFAFYFRTPRAPQAGEIEATERAAYLAGLAIERNIAHERLLRATGQLQIELAERRRTEEALREQTLRLEMATRFGNVGLWDWDLVTNKAFFSPEWKSQIGYEGPEISDEYREWESRLHPEDRERAVRAARAFVDRPEGSYSAEFRLRHKDGSYRAILAQGALLRDEQGAPSRMMGSHIDITERKKMETTLHEAEARLRAMTDNSPMGISLKDLDGRYLFVNSRFLEWHGLRSEDVLGKIVGDVFPDRRLDSMLSQERDVVASGQPIKRTEAIVFRDGSTHSLEIVKFLVPGPMPGIGSMGIDVTKQREAEEQLRQLHKMEAIGQLTGGIAHDFNNLLTVILGNAEMLAEALAEDPDLKHVAEMIGLAGQRGADLTHNLLAFSRKQVLEPRTTDVKALVMRMEGLLRRTLGEHVEIELVAGPDPWPATVDPTQLETSILNLAVNARDAMPGGGKLTIEIAGVELDETYARQSPGVTPGRYVMIAVSDTGCGMTPEVMAKAFEPFFTTKQPDKGTGLGLSMVYGLVKQSSGHIKLYSEVGRGTTVKLFLPHSDKVELPDDLAPRSAPLRGGEEIVLVVEDNELVRDHVEQQVRSLGYRVRLAANAAEALQILGQDGTIDLLFTDVVMPGGMNGVELAREARSLRPTLKVLLTSGFTETAVTRQGALDPDVELLSKPYRRVDLAAKFRKVLSAAPDAS